MIDAEKLRRLAVDIEDGTGGYSEADRVAYSTWLRLQADTYTVGMVDGAIAWQALIPENFDTEATLLHIVGRALEWARPTAITPEYPFPGGVDGTALLRVLDYWRDRVQANVQAQARQSIEVQR